MKIPILRLRDKDGKEVFIPAIRGPQGPAGDGTGDMVTSVYDPKGKAQDVYQYAESAAADAASGSVAKKGDTMTGPLILSGDPSGENHAANKRYVDNTVEAAQPELMLASEFDAKTQADWEDYLEEGKIVWRLG